MHKGGVELIFNSHHVTNTSVCVLKGDGGGGGAAGGAGAGVGGIRKIFVGGIAMGTTKEDVQEFFGKYGEVRTSFYM